MLLLSCPTRTSELRNLLVRSVALLLSFPTLPSPPLGISEALPLGICGDVVFFTHYTS